MVLFEIHHFPSFPSICVAPSPHRRPVQQKFVKMANARTSRASMISKQKQERTQ